MNSAFRSLKVGLCHDILNAKDNEQYQVQIQLAERLLKKIDEILKAHVKNNATAVVSKEELQVILDKMSLIISMRDQLSRIPGSADHVKEHLKTVDEVEAKLDSITKLIELSKEKLSGLQTEVNSDSSDVFYYST